MFDFLSLIVPAVLPPTNIQTPYLKPAPFDVQGHRGSRGNAIENTLPAFAWALIDGATTLELDNGVTKACLSCCHPFTRLTECPVAQDGVVVVWHDEHILPEKCRDTAPISPDDEQFPYVGKLIVDLTLAQIKTLDCGSQRQENYPLQLTYPGTKISTLEEVFAFVECADSDRLIKWNIESKIDAVHPERTASVDAFVQKQYAIFVKSGYKHAITFQSFDWRSLVAIKKLDPSMITSALAEYDTTLAYAHSKERSPWLAGRDVHAFPGSSYGSKLTAAAHSINATIISPSAENNNISLASRDMVDTAHRLGMLIKPWTVNSLDIAQDLLDWGADGIITDYPNVVRRFVQQQGRRVAPKYPKRRVLGCLEQFT
ncbi:PLC-like phosphodiesterase [Mycena kentingensis (nom. inval.)]|nr:PLC-like phosphodiesterase [Mycena kentingensis (nom. inval.)]